MKLRVLPPPVGTNALEKRRESVTFIGPFMVRYVTYVVGQSVYGDEGWRKFMRTQAQIDVAAVRGGAL